MSVFHSISLGWTAGTFHSLFKEASRISNLTGMKANFEFQDIKVNISPKSTESFTYLKCMDAVRGLHKGCYGEGV